MDTLPLVIQPFLHRPYHEFGALNCAPVQKRPIFHIARILFGRQHKLPVDGYIQCTCHVRGQSIPSILHSPVICGVTHSRQKTCYDSGNSKGLFIELGLASGLSTAVGIIDVVRGVDLLMGDCQTVLGE